jgi:hypothetical protein
MLQTRSAVPLLSSSSPQPWQLRALLRLPPELRQIAVRAFSSSAPVRSTEGGDGSGSDVGGLRIRKHSPASHPEYRRLRGHPSKLSKAQASQGHTAEVEEHGGSSAPIPLGAQPFYRQIANDSNTRAISQELSIRAVAMRTWGTDPEMDELVRALEATTDKTARWKIRGKIRQLQSQRQTSRTDLSDADRGSPGYDWSSLSKPFEQQHDPSEGFADAVVGSSAVTGHGSASTAKRLTKTVFAPSAGLTLRKLQDIRKDLDPEKDKDELQKIDTQLRRIKRSLHAAGEELHQYRKTDELEEYTRVERELGKQDLTDEERIALKTERQRLNLIADKRRSAGERDLRLQAQMREEMFGENPPAVVVLANGGVNTVEEREEYARLEMEIKSHQRFAKRDPKFIGRLRSRQFVLQRMAYLRGGVLRDQPHSERIAQHAITTRLALLKKTLLESPENVSGAPEIKAQLKELEDALRLSLKAAVPPSRPSPKVDKRVATEAALAQLAINFRHDKENVSVTSMSTEVKPLVEDTQGADKEPESPSATAQHTFVPQPPPTHPPAASAEPTPAVGSTPSNTPPRTEDLSIFTELRSQMQELNSLLKLLVTQHAAVQSSPAAAGVLPELVQKVNGTMSAVADAVATSGIETSGRYSNLIGSISGRAGALDDFSDLPHEAVSRPEAANEEPLQDLPHPQATDSITDIPSALANPSPTGSEAVVESTSDLEELSSLYEQLFPEDAAQSKAAYDKRIPVPRLSLPQESATGTQDRPPGISEQPATSADPEVEHWKSVLIFSGASKTLTEDDFRRAIPRGKHFQEWTKSAYERVIPVRDFWTLEPTGDYYIVFNHHKKADAFLAHVKRVFNMTKSHTPTSLLSELPPAPSGLLRDGAEDEAELVRNFTLATPSMSLNLQRADKGIKAEVLKRGAYPQVLAGNLTPETPQVLLDLEGGVMPNWFQIRDAIARDGTRRSLPWNLISGDLAIRRLAMQRPTSQTDLEADYESTVNDGANELVARDNLAEMDSGYDSDATMLARERLERGEQGQRWVVAFREREEAQRFARQWHMRAFPWTEAEYRVHRTYQNRTRMKVEMLW